MKRAFLFFCTIGILCGNAWGEEILFCNQVPEESVFLAVGYKKQEQWMSQGWFLARSGRCYQLGTAVDGDVLYYMAYTSSKSQTWGGKTNFCISGKPFLHKIANLASPECDKLGGQTVGFKEVIIEGYKKTMVYLTPIRGRMVSAVPYPEAEEAKLTLWASEGDPNAQVELKRRADIEDR